MTYRPWLYGVPKADATLDGGWGVRTVVHDLRMLLQIDGRNPQPIGDL
ncbi:MAG: hypothetical protein M9936_23460 [Caldilinea sp.]|nr:hypothetical protein [Caldilinea sp.]